MPLINSLAKPFVCVVAFRKPVVDTALLLVQLITSCFPQDARLELLDRSIMQDLVEWNQVSMVSDQQVGPCPTRSMPSYATGEE